MSEQLEWIYPFKTIIYSRDELHRNRLSSAITIKDKNSVICLRNIDNDEVTGYLKFTVDPSIDSMNEIENTAKSLFTKFENSILLKGLVLKKTQFGKLKCTNCQGRTFRVSSTTTIKYNIEGETKTISENERQQIDKFFNEIESDQKLLEIANDVGSQEKIRKDIGNFVWCWISFNRIYNPNQIRDNEWTQIKNYIDDLSAAKINSLINRNNALFTLLSKSNIERITQRGTKIDASNELENAIKNGNKKDIIKKSIDCVYQLRNELFHYGRLNFQDLPRLTNFVFDLVYLDQIIQYGENAVTSFYDIQ